jgi:hypothetical protein
MDYRWKFTNTGRRNPRKHVPMVAQISRACTMSREVIRELVDAVLAEDEIEEGVPREKDPELAAIWKKTPKDYRSSINGVRHVVAHGDSGSVLTPLHGLSADQRKRKLGK